MSAIGRELPRAGARPSPRTDAARLAQGPHPLNHRADAHTVMRVGLPSRQAVRADNTLARPSILGSICSQQVESDLTRFGNHPALRLFSSRPKTGRSSTHFARVSG